MTLDDDGRILSADGEPIQRTFKEPIDAIIYHEGVIYPPRVAALREALWHVMLEIARGDPIGASMVADAALVADDVRGDRNGQV